LAPKVEPLPSAPFTAPPPAPTPPPAAAVARLLLVVVVVVVEVVAAVETEVVGRVVVGRVVVVSGVGGVALRKAFKSKATAMERPEVHLTERKDDGGAVVGAPTNTGGGQWG